MVEVVASEAVEVVREDIKKMLLFLSSLVAIPSPSGPEGPDLLPLLSKDQTAAILPLMFYSLQLAGVEAARPMHKMQVQPVALVAVVRMVAAVEVLLKAMQVVTQGIAAMPVVRVVAVLLLPGRQQVPDSMAETVEMEPQTIFQERLSLTRGVVAVERGIMAHHGAQVALQGQEGAQQAVEAPTA